MSSHSLPRTIADDLLSVLLDEEETAYPWDLADPNTEAIFREREEAFSLLDGSEEGEILDRSATFFATLQQRWDAIENGTGRTSLFDRFAPLLPSEYLTRLIESAETLIDRPIDPLDRLVACIHPLFPKWLDEDLQVFARPHALALRDEGTPPVKNTRDWRTLSESERIRRSASIAAEILRELTTKP
ncbi:hypothetical protein V0288_18605 [Pannus brasiliensis CCIBt3594]|uniref:Uncharacterized protein n=1 Tax=Pannus brasiliensis CCIBt3594 TaxID=1427578 RepID=A0AAW9QVF2_9CHRO